MNENITRDGWGFPRTTWNAIYYAKDRTSNEYKDKLGMLITLYWDPVNTYIKLCWKMSHEDARDLTQEYFTRFIEKDFLRPVEKEKGKFRTYVKRTLKHFMINVVIERSAKKRGGDKTKVSLEGINEGLADNRNEDPAQVFEKEWAKSILHRAMNKMKEHLARKNKEAYIKVFEMYHQNLLQKDLSRRDIAQKLGLTEDDVKNYLTHTRRLLRKIVRDEVCDYVLDPKDVDEEMNHILSIM